MNLVKSALIIVQAFAFNVLLINCATVFAQPDFFNHSKKEDTLWIKTHFIIEHSDSLIDFSSHSTLNYRLVIVRESKTTVHFKIEVKSITPSPNDLYPLSILDDKLQIYLTPSRYINSDHQIIGALADSILNLAPIQTQHELVYRVIRFTTRHLFWGNPSGLPSASDAYQNRAVNCIGFTNLAAAILRNLGIPTRTLRTFMGLSLVPHYLLEVYYPSEDNWITFDAQTGIPNPSNIALYTHHDWDFDGQKRTRPLVTDPKIKVYFGN